MRHKASVLIAGVLFVFITTAGAVQQTLPASLTAKEFWALTERFSEPNGYFRSNSGSPDNLLSNENTLSTVAGQLAQQLKPNGVYLGVGPEQNFTYIAAIRPRLAIITDIRRGNLHLHLLYKAAFELTTNRADFVAHAVQPQAAAWSVGHVHGLAVDECVPPGRSRRRADVQGESESRHRSSDEDA